MPHPDWVLGPVYTGKKISTTEGFKPQTVHPKVSLYWLHYHGFPASM